MFSPENEPKKDPKNDPEHWPPCGRAQADGVPCQELDRDCEKCEQAYPELESPSRNTGENTKRNENPESR